MDATRKGVTDQDDRHEDVADEADEQQDLIPGSPAARRMEAMEALSRSRVAAMEEETGERIGRDEDDPPAAEPAPKDPAPNGPDKPAPQAAAPSQLDQQLTDDDILTPDMLHRKVRLKVDGEEVVVPLEQVLRTAQKSEAADRRLQQATELLRQAQMQAQARETTGNMDSSAGADPSRRPEAAPPTDETVKSRLKDALDAIFSGDQDAAAEAFAQVLTAREQSQPVDADALADVVAQKVDERSALDRFLNAYPRIAANPYLQRAADDALAAFRSQGKPFTEALELAGQTVYEQFGYEREQAAPEAPRPTTNRQETLRERKAALDIPAGRTVSAATTRNAPESSEAQRSSTIAEMAAARRGDPGAARRG